jgi:hypothetical protein
MKEVEQAMLSPTHVASVKVVHDARTRSVAVTVTITVDVAIAAGHAHSERQTGLVCGVDLGL